MTTIEFWSDNWKKAIRDAMAERGATANDILFVTGWLQKCAKKGTTEDYMPYAQVRDGDTTDVYAPQVGIPLGVKTGGAYTASNKHCVKVG